MKRRTKRKIKKVLSKNIFLILFIGIFSSIFLLGTAYSLIQSNLDVKGVALIGDFFFTDDNVCSSMMHVDNIQSYDYTTQKTVTITISNDSDTNMKDIIFVYEPDGTETSVVSAQGAEVTRKDNKQFIKVYDWYIQGQTGHQYLEPGDTLTMDFQIDGGVTVVTVKSRLSLVNCGQDKEQEGGSTTNKITNGNIEMNLNVLEKELPLTVEVVDFAKWNNIYSVKITATNPYDEPISSFRFTTSYDSDLSYNGINPWTGSIEDNKEKHVLTGSYNLQNPLAPGATYEITVSLISNTTIKEQICADWGCYEGGYEQHPITVYALAAGIFS